MNLPESEQLNNIIYALQMVANHDYSHKVPLSDDDDFYNAVSIAINTLIDHLEDSVVEKRLLQESEKKVTDSLQRLNKTLEEHDDGIITLNQDREIIFYNEAAQNLFGHDKSDIVGENINILISPNQKRKYNLLIDKTFEVSLELLENRTSEFYLCKKDSTWFWGSISLSRVIYDNETLLTIFIRDITKKKEFDDNIKRINTLLVQKSEEDSEEIVRINIILDLLLGNLPVQFLAFNKEGNLLYSKGAQLIQNDLIYVPKSQAPPISLKSIFEMQKSINKDFKALLKGKEVKFLIEYENQYLDVILSSSFDGKGKFQNIGCVISDATDVVKSQIRIKQAYEKEKEAGILRDKFITGVSHQFRTPLTNIQANFELMQMHNTRGSLTQEQCEILNTRISHGIGEISSLLNKMLALSNKPLHQITSTMKPTDLVQLCKDKLGMFKPNKLKVTGKPRKLLLDANTFGLSLYEIFSNAHKFSDQQSFDVTVKFLKDSVKLVVTDYGIGMAQHEIHAIFTPYYRSEDAIAFKGQGTGLAIAKKHLITNNATIRVESKHKQFSSFTITLKEI